MKKLQMILLTLGTAVALTVAVAPQAESAGAFLSYWNAGSEIGDSGESIGGGFGVGIKHTITFPNFEMVSLDLRGSWIRFSDSDESVNMFPMEAMARTDFSMFYAGAGMGYYVLDGETFRFDNNVGFFGAVGLEYSPAKVGGFLELKYTILDTTIGEFTEADLNGLGINAGVTMTW